MASQKPVQCWTDPLKRKICLARYTWSGHVLKHHPDMAFRLSEAGRAVEDPDEIWKDGADRVYYRKTVPDADGNDIMKVAARLEPNEFKSNGFVTSAYAVGEKKPEGVLEWQKSSE